MGLTRRSYIRGQRNLYIIHQHARHSGYIKNPPQTHTEVLPQSTQFGVSEGVGGGVWGEQQCSQAGA